MLRFRGHDGLSLAADEWPGERRTPVVLLHGGGQTRHAWGTTGRALAQRGWPVVAVDQRGHGESDWAPDGSYALEDYAADVVAVAAQLQAPPVLVGASLGGYAAMLALGAPSPPPAAALVLVDIAHRFEVAGAQRVVSFMSGRSSGFADVAEAAAAVAEYLPHREARPDARLENNLRERDGRYYWHWDPALVEGEPRLLDPARQDDHTARHVATLGAAEIPLLLVRGGASDVVTAEIAAEFAALNPRAEVVTVPGARHMVAGDDNATFAAAILDFLGRRVA